jgi:hypothetical protein
MIKLISVVLLCCILQHSLNLDKSSTKPQTFKLDLNIPVKERYREILTHFKDIILKGSKLFEKIPAYSEMAKKASKITKQDQDWLDYAQLVSEITGLTLGESMMLSSTYELGCTSALIRDSNGQIIFGRNLDFKNYEIITHAVYEADYYRNGVLVYRGVEVAGYFGAINSVKPGKFAVALNLRSSDSKSNIKRIFDGYRTPSYHLMKIMETAESYEEAVRLMSRVPITASTYYIISSLNKGAVITRSSSEVIRVDKLEDGKWFLVVTNTDLDKPENYRRKVAEDRIKNLGQHNVNYDTVLNIMKQYPINNQLTIYTTVQSASGHVDTTVWLS